MSFIRRQHTDSNRCNPSRGRAVDFFVVPLTAKQVVGRIFHPAWRAGTAGARRPPSSLQRDLNEPAAK
jgi:hypothetical protein